VGYRIQLPLASHHRTWARARNQWPLTHCLACRYQTLDTEITTLNTELARLVATTAPGLVARFGIGPDSAGALLVAAGDNPDRLRSDACFSMLCGSSPIQASSGKTTVTAATVAATAKPTPRCTGSWSCGCAGISRPVTTWQWHGLKQGKSKKEVIRCFKRYVAREVFAVFAVLQQMSQDDSLTPTT